MKTALLLITDLNYGVPTQVLIESIKVNSPTLLERSDLLIYSDFPVFPESIVRKIDLGKVNKTLYPDFVFNMMSMLIYAIEELKTKYDRIIYLDSDCLVLKDISHLIDEPFDGKGMMAVPDWTAGKVFEEAFEDPRALARGDFTRSYQKNHLTMVNTGVVIIDCKKIKNGMIDRYIKQVPGYKFPDQDFLSEEYLDDIKYLPYEYNARPEGCLRKCLTEEEMDCRYSALHYQPIVHFFGGCKPWMEWYPPREDFCAQVPYLEWIKYMNMVQNPVEDNFKDYVNTKVIDSIPKKYRDRPVQQGLTMDDLLDLKFLHDLKEKNR